MQQLIDQCNAKDAELLADAERIDWMADQECQINWLTCGGVTKYQLVWPADDSCQTEWYPTSREAIDAAIAKAKGGE